MLIRLNAAGAEDLRITQSSASFSESGVPGLRRHYTQPAIIILSVGTLCHAFSGVRPRGSVMRTY